MKFGSVHTVDLMDGQALFRCGTVMDVVWSFLIPIVQSDSRICLSHAHCLLRLALKMGSFTDEDELSLRPLGVCLELSFGHPTTL